MEHEKKHGEQHHHEVHKEHYKNCCEGKYWWARNWFKLVIAVCLLLLTFNILAGMGRGHGYWGMRKAGMYDHGYKKMMVDYKMKSVLDEKEEEIETENLEI